MRVLFANPNPNPHPNPNPNPNSNPNPNPHQVRVLFVGDCMNCALIVLFGQFYFRSYLRGSGPSSYLPAAPKPVAKRA